MRLAQNYLRDPLGVEFGLLVCSEKMTLYYGKLGWLRVTAPTWIEQSKGRVILPGPFMILPVCSLEWPEGEIDLKGKPW
jgi:hypothetical protein